MPIVRIELFPGRSPEMKQEIAARLTELLNEVAGINPNATTVLFQESAPEDWFVAGQSYAAASREPNSSS